MAKHTENMNIMNVVTIQQKVLMLKKSWNKCGGSQLR